MTDVVSGTLNLLVIFVLVMGLAIAMFVNGDKHKTSRRNSSNKVGH